MSNLIAFSVNFDGFLIFVLIRIYFFALFDLVSNVGLELVMHLDKRSHVATINLKPLLLQVRSSRKGGGDIRLDSSHL